MLLIIGLGNPDRQYKNTRHNIGFMLLDLLVTRNEKWQISKKGQIKFIKKEIAGKSIGLLKPQTYMNNSGQAVIYTCEKHHLKPENIIVIHDDIDLPLGKIKISKNSSSGGHRGVQSIIDRLDSKNFIRLRIGVAPAVRPPKFIAAKYVLKNFSQSEQAMLAATQKQAHQAIEAIITHGPEKAMNQFNV